jgi:hypothetical protein
MKARFQSDYGLSAYDATTLTAAREIAASSRPSVAAPRRGRTPKDLRQLGDGRSGRAPQREELEIAASPGQSPRSSAA